MRYLKFDSIDGAEQRSSELWEQRLARPKREEDVTAFLYPFVIAETADGGSYLLIPDEGTLLTSTETDALEDESSFWQWKQTHQPVEYAAYLEENS